MSHSIETTDFKAKRKHYDDFENESVLQSKLSHYTRNTYIKIDGERFLYIGHHGIVSVNRVVDCQESFLNSLFLSDRKVSFFNK